MGERLNDSSTTFEDDFLSACQSVLALAIDDGTNTYTPRTCQFYFPVQNGVEPASPSCTINVINDYIINRSEETSWVNGITHKARVLEQRQCLVRLVFVGREKYNGTSDNTASNTSREMHIKLTSPYCRFPFTDKGITVLRVGQIIKAQSKRETEIFSTYTMDLTVGYTSMFYISQNYINDVDYSGTFTQAVNGELTITN